MGWTSENNNGWLGDYSTEASNWKLLTTVEQSNNAISDPGSFTSTGTSFNGETFCIKIAGDTTQVDGFQENWAGWSQKIITLYPDFNSDTVLRLQTCP